MPTRSLNLKTIHGNADVKLTCGTMLAVQRFIARIAISRTLDNPAMHPVVEQITPAIIHSTDALDHSIEGADKIEPINNRGITVQEFKRLVTQLERPSLFDLGLILCLLTLSAFALQVF